jgi:response regulator RpfG family c-di-GMP phosphodiesterase
MRNEEDGMNAQILYIGASAAHWPNWNKNLDETGYVVIHAADEREAVELLKKCQVDVVCIDSQLMGKAGASLIGASLETADPHVPVVLIQSGSKAPPNFEEHVDVVIDESTFSAIGHWLIEELLEVRFPLFVEWLDGRKLRMNDSNDKFHVC